MTSKHDVELLQSIVDLFALSERPYFDKTSQGTWEICLRNLWPLGGLVSVLVMLMAPMQNEQPAFVNPDFN